MQWVPVHRSWWLTVHPVIHCKVQKRGELDNNGNFFISVHCLAVYCLLVTSLACPTSLDLQVDLSWGNKGSVLLQQWKTEPWDDAGTLNYLSWQIKQLSSFTCRGSFLKCLIPISLCNASITPVLYPHWNHAESPVAPPFSGHASHPHPGFVFGDREMFLRPSGSSSSRARPVLQQPRASWPSRRWMSSSCSCPSSPRRMTSRVSCSRSVAGEGRNQPLKVCLNTGVVLYKLEWVKNESWATETELN